MQTTNYRVPMMTDATGLLACAPQSKLLPAIRLGVQCALFAGEAKLSVDVTHLILGPGCGDNL